MRPLTAHGRNGRRVPHAAVCWLLGQPGARLELRAQALRRFARMAGRYGDVTLFVHWSRRLVFLVGLRSAASACSSPFIDAAYDARDRSTGERDRITWAFGHGSTSRPTGSGPGSR